MGRPVNVPASPRVRGSAVLYLRRWVLRIGARELAARVGVSETTVRAWESGDRPVSEPQARELVRALSTTREVLARERR
jgi:DNA-binding transcriptional regulator YiaG